MLRRRPSLISSRWCKTGFGASPAATTCRFRCSRREEVLNMRKTLLGLGILTMVTLVAPRMANAGVSISIGLPGVYVGGHFPGPPIVYPRRYAYGSPVYYRPYYRHRAYYGPYYRHGRDCHYDRRYHRRYRY
jgi:hypothetical protein